jgi:hypothetical protein
VNHTTTDEERQDGGGVYQPADDQALPVARLFSRLGGEVISAAVTMDQTPTLPRIKTDYTRRRPTKQAEIVSIGATYEIDGARPSGRAVHSFTKKLE